MIKLKDIKPKPKNPRILKDEKFKKLAQSLNDFPEMMEARPIVIDENIMVLGGNVRLKALKYNGVKEIPDNWIHKVNNWTEEQKREFIIKDNVAYGEWDWDVLANEWENDLLVEWGLDLPFFDKTIREKEVGEQVTEHECPKCGYKW